jgi:hypothetical protein
MFPGSSLRIRLLLLFIVVWPELLPQQVDSFGYRSSRARTRWSNSSRFALTSAWKS